MPDKSRIGEIRNEIVFKSRTRLEVRLLHSLGNKGKILFPLLMAFIIFNSLVAEAEVKGWKDYRYS